MSIRQLPSHVVDKLKSSVTITSLNGVVCGLLANALDAGASKVNISIDYARGNCTVEDNGSGISPEEFKDTGGIGKLHHTSRLPPRATIHGKHGDFLASLATLSLLSVSSRHNGNLSHNSVTIHNSTVLSRNLPAPPEQRIINFDHGTRVVVRDLFGAMPVRVKQRAAAHERSVSDREWTKLLREVVALLLSWPSAVTVSLKSATTQREVRFRPSEKQDMVSRTSRLLGQASLMDSSEVDSWVPISASSGSITIKGCICETPAATRRSQFVSLGIHPMMNEYGTDVVYEEINRVFQNSSFGVVDGDNAQPQDPKLDDFTGNELRSRKGIERWPMFYFKIMATGHDVDAVHKLESQSQTLTAILDLLKATCYGFLKKHHFRPRKVHLSPDESVFSTSKTVGRSKKSKRLTPASRSRASSVPRHPESESQPRADSPFDDWNRVKVGRATASKPTKTTEGSKPAALLVGEGGKLLRKPFDDPEENGVKCSRPTILTVNDSGLPASDTPLSETLRTPAGDPANGQPKPQRSTWLQNVMKSWENPIFEATEPEVPRIVDDESLHRRGQKRHDIGFDAASVSLHGRVSRRALAHATVISQVDRKFILVKLPLEDTAPKDSSATNPTSALIMLDQHAVDERCRLEDLMTDYFARDEASRETKANVEGLERALVFEVSSKERQLLDQHRDHFAAWGIVYNVPPQSSRHPDGCKVVTTGLPPSILERCRQEPRLLIELLRKEVWHLADNDISHPRASTSQTDTPWISRFHGCPQGILEMLHSRACRSAIMFNDPLTNDECVQLLSRLSRCAFPFQCAHGRPSMAPLVDLGAGGRFGRWQDNKRREDKSKWKAWMTAPVNSDTPHDTRKSAIGI